MSKNTAPVKSKPAQTSGSEKSFAFDKQNYLLMIAGIVVILLGFILMILISASELLIEYSEIFTILVQSSLVPRKIPYRTSMALYYLDSSKLVLLRCPTFVLLLRA